MVAMIVERWAGLGSAAATVIFLWSVVQNYVPPTFRLYLTAWAAKVAACFNPYLQITISEYGAERFQRSDFFLAVEAYLSVACARRARKLKAELGKDSKNLQVTVDDHEEVTDDFSGTTIWWYASKRQSKAQVISFYPGEDERRFYRVVFHRRHRDLVVDSYLPFVLGEGRAVTVKNRERRLFTNNASRSWNPYRSNSVWSHVPFEHPATFDTLAMHPDEKEAVVDDLMAFQESKDYYATELRKLFIETTGKSIIVIEDIDCSIDLTGKQRKDKKASGDKDSDGDDKPKLPMDPEKDDATKVTLSGLLNFIDGLWSACGGERIIIFTTNHREKLDPALIRRGRMDKHIEMSYCRFEGFKVLAKNYLEVIEHDLFGEIQQLLEETDMSPADVAENLMPMSKKKKRDPDLCFSGLVEALKQAKEDAVAAAAKAKEEEEADVKKTKEAEAKKVKEKEEADVKKTKEENKGEDKPREEANGDIKEGDK